MPAYHRQTPDHPRFAALTSLLERWSCSYRGSSPIKRAGINGTISTYLTRCGFLFVIDYDKTAHARSGFEVFTPAHDGIKISATIEAIERWLGAGPAIPDDAPDYELIGVLTWLADRTVAQAKISELDLPQRFRPAQGETFDPLELAQRFYQGANPATRRMLDSSPVFVIPPPMCEGFAELPGSPEPPQGNKPKLAVVH